MTDLQAFDVETDDHGVTTVTLIGPGRGNAMGPEFWTELPALFARLGTDPGTRAIVLTGTGSCFSVGLDLKRVAEPEFLPAVRDRAMAADRLTLLQRLRQLQAAMTAVADCRKPVLAAIHGWCLGGGVDLAACVDVRYCSADAVFSIREARVAIVADAGSLQRLPAIIGDGALRELALTGKDIDAARALQIGLVNEVLPDRDAVLRRAVDTAREMAANPQFVLHGIKDVLAQQSASAVAGGLNYVTAWNAAFLPSHDLAEAVVALGERRPPVFSDN
ncbi:crotonase/enoyl-CoA hydratase family protein [Gordonia asplenii]|nr:crotonase/enoyl-CoA hydratase family protein [Gordonia asplenii]